MSRIGIAEGPGGFWGGFCRLPLITGDKKIDIEGHHLIPARRHAPPTFHPPGHPVTPPPFLTENNLKIVVDLDP